MPVHHRGRRLPATGTLRRALSVCIGIAVLLTPVGCTVVHTDTARDGWRPCADIVARAITSPDRTVVGAFACMSPEERNFWHRWAISRDDQLPEVVRLNGLTRAGPVDGYDNDVRWSAAEYFSDMEVNHHLYLVRSVQDPTARGFLVLITDLHRLVDHFAFLRNQL